MEFFDFNRIPIYALDISDQSFKFLRLSNSKGGIVVKNFGEGGIHKGIVENGEIKDKNGLSEILKETFEENNIKFVALSLPEEKGFLREIKISGVNEEELLNALEFQIEEYIPLPAADTFFDYTVTERGNNFFSLVVNAFPKSIVELYMEVVNASGALPVIVESELDSTARSIMPKDFLKITMVVDWGKTRATFSIFENKILRFTSTASVGGELLEIAISKNLNVSKSEAIKAKLKADLNDLQSSPEIFNVILPVISELIEEIKKILEYWHSRSENKTKIEYIFISGGDANLFGLSEYLSKKLEIPVSLANPWVNIEFPAKYLPPIKYKDSLRFASAIGLSLRAFKEEIIV
ncbi:MAG: type IV pilus assembly protein PilM [Patescibacteria group bacterium]